jgi:phosphoenolpyruvate synthase/pyruvate phosphate dikinase
MENARILNQVGWLTNRETVYIPSKTKEEIERIKSQENEYYCNMFRVEIMFLQEKGLTTRTILNENDIVNDNSKLTLGDLTDDGFRFYQTGITKWIEKLDRSTNRMKIVTDTSFLEKKYQEYINYELPFFKKLLSETNEDRKILESKKKLTPLIEKIISELEGDIREFFTERNKKATIDLMGRLCYGYTLTR